MFQYLTKTPFWKESALESCAFIIEDGSRSSTEHTLFVVGQWPRHADSRVHTECTCKKKSTVWPLGNTAVFNSGAFTVGLISWRLRWRKDAECSGNTWVTAQAATTSTLCLFSRYKLLRGHTYRVCPPSILPAFFRHWVDGIVSAQMLHGEGQ